MSCDLKQKELTFHQNNHSVVIIVSIPTDLDVTEIVQKLL